jgi:hypothetical protein
LSKVAHLPVHLIAKTGHDRSDKNVLKKKEHWSKAYIKDEIKLKYICNLYIMLYEVS